jgi:hypothetical protein
MGLIGGGIPGLPALGGGAPGGAGSVVRQGLVGKPAATPTPDAAAPADDLGGSVDQHYLHARNEVANRMAATGVRGPGTHGTVGTVQQFGMCLLLLLLYCDRVWGVIVAVIIVVVVIVFSLISLQPPARLPLPAVRVVPVPAQ